MATQRQPETLTPSRGFSLYGDPGYVGRPDTDRGRGQLVHTDLRRPPGAAPIESNGDGFDGSVRRRELPATVAPHDDNAWLAETVIAAVGVAVALILLISACLCERPWTTVALMGATALCNPATRAGIRRARRGAKPADPAWTAA